jgi:hypothetical protein
MVDNHEIWYGHNVWHATPNGLKPFSLERYDSKLQNRPRNVLEMMDNWTATRVFRSL